MGLSLEFIYVPLCVVTFIGDSLVVDQICRSCFVTALDYDTWVYFIMLDVMDFDEILGMDWLSNNHTFLDCFVKTITLVIS